MPENEVLHSVFKKDTQTETSHLRILWTYSKDGSWQSPEKLAKYTFGDEKAMYKLYLIRNVDGGAPPIGEDPVVGFAREFLPVLGQTLFAPGGPTEGGGEEQAATDAPAEKTLAGK